MVLMVAEKQRLVTSCRILQIHYIVNVKSNGKTVLMLTYWSIIVVSVKEISKRTLLVFLRLAKQLSNKKTLLNL